MTKYTIDELNKATIDELASSVLIPPRPSLLQDLQNELALEDPCPNKIATIASQDVAVSAAVLKIVNSSFYGLNRRADTLAQAASFIGISALASLISGLVARHSLKSEGPAMTRFWDVSSRRAQLLHKMSRRLRLASPDVAQTFGLFCDLGIPLLVKKFQNYMDTLALANTTADKSFTEVEQARHRTDHALVGAIMAKTWGLSDTISGAIRVHHEYELLASSLMTKEVKNLVAMGLVAEHVIQEFTGLNKSVEWTRGREHAMEHLGLQAYDLAELKDDLLESLQ